MGWGRGKDEEKTFDLKKTIYFRRGQVNLDLKHSIQYIYLLYVLVLYTKECEFAVGADPKGFPLGWRGPGKEASFSRLVYCLLR